MFFIQYEIKVNEKTMRSIFISFCFVLFFFSFEYLFLFIITQWFLFFNGFQWIDMKWKKNYKYFHEIKNKRYFILKASKQKTQTKRNEFNVSVL